MICLNHVSFNYILKFITRGGMYAPWTGTDQRTACRSEFSPATTWILGMELESSAMVAGTSTHWAILLASETKNLRFRSQDSPGFNSRSDWFAIKIDTNRGTHALSCLPPRLTQDWQNSPSFFLSLCLQLLYVSLLFLCCVLGNGRAETNSYKHEQGQHHAIRST